MNPILLVLSLVLPTPSLAQASASAPGPSVMKATGAFFALSVADVHTSAKWYSEKLGLSVVMDAPKQEKAAVIVLEGSGLIVELIQHDDAVPLNTAAPAAESKILVHGLVKAGAIVADFDRTLTTLRERNVRIAFGPYPATATQRANVIIQDNAGNLIQFFGQQGGR